METLIKLHSVVSDESPLCLPITLGWSGGAKVSCILRHRGVQLILAYSWARPAILVAGKGRWGIFLFLLFLSLSFLFLSSLFLSLISSTISSITFLPFSGRWHKMTHKGWRVVKPQHNQLPITYFWISRLNGRKGLRLPLIFSLPVRKLVKIFG